MESNNIPIFDTSKKDDVGVVSEDVPAGLSPDLKEHDVEVAVVEGGGGNHSQVVDDDLATAPSPEIPWKMPAGFCRKCHCTLDIEVDGRGGMWIDPHGKGRVVVDRCGLCSDCEYTKSVETDPNWGRSMRISSEEREEGSSGSSSSEYEEVSSSTPSKKKQ
ncbi:hypothetical protein KSS87_007993 [Heliosperma pusillum]|nr:hypothetical protein KSS87_007993 [Heliosperma pusillum]